MDGRIAAARHALGKECVILGHHYQRDEVVRFADFLGDSYRFRKSRRRPTDATSFFAECISWPRAPTCSARPGQSVILPDLNAGCSMADMAEISQVEAAWEQFVAWGFYRRRRQWHHAHYLHELDSGHQGFLRRAQRFGVHLLQREGSL